MNYWLLALLIASNTALIFYVFRAARLSRALRNARARNKSLKAAMRRDTGQARDPAMVAALKSSRLAPMTSFATNRRTKQDDVENFLPPLDSDLAAFRGLIDSETPHDPHSPRSDMDNHRRRLRDEFRGQPEICYINALCIAYLRRRTPHTKHARALFDRLWDEDGAFLAEASRTRWLLSTLLTFMEHGRTSGQRMIGSAGIVFGNTVKIYEWERVACGLAPDSAYETTELGGDLAAFPGVGRISIGGGDIGRNTLAYLTDLALRDRVAGQVLLELLARLSDGATAFTRLDRAKLALDAACPEDERPRRHWSFGQHPSERG